MPTEDRTPFTAKFETRFRRPPEFAADAGGRVNLIGEHTDYHEGLVLPAALDLRTHVLGAQRTDGSIRVWSNNMNQGASCAVVGLGPPMETDWRSYVLGPLWALRESGVSLSGLDVLVQGDVPLGGGLSSSASVEVAVAGLALAINGVSMDPMELALLSQRAEREFCHVPCGIMDQAAAACGRKGHALLLDCRSLEMRPIRFPRQWSLVVADSGVKHSLASSEYARRQEECSVGLAVIRETYPDIRSARDISIEVMRESRALMPAVSYRRLMHVVTENARVLDACDALEEADAEALGRLLSGSHESLAASYEVSCSELDTLVELAYGLKGVIGARLTGAGFGGNTVNMVRADHADGFCTVLRDRYASRTGKGIKVRVVRPDDGLRVREIRDAT